MANYDKEKQLAANKRYIERLKQDPEKWAEYQAKVKARLKKWYENHQETQKEKFKLWIKNNPEKAKGYVKKYREKKKLERLNNIQKNT